jgi:hypothetical protein
VIDDQGESPDLADGGGGGFSLRDAAALGLERLGQLGAGGRGFMHDEDMGHEVLPCFRTSTAINIAIATPRV